MYESKMYVNKGVKLRNPILLVGLPGIGNVGSLVGEHLRKELRAKKFATLYSPHFPHQVIMLKSGGVRLLSNRFYYWRNPSKDRSAGDIIILTGDSQAITTEGQYEINEKIVKFLKKLGGKVVYTIGGYNSGNQYVKNPRVFGVTTDKQSIGGLKSRGVIFGEAVGMIWGSAGLIVAFAKKYGINGACIMGETGLLDVDANAAKAVLEVLVKHLNLNINLENIDKIRKETEKMLSALDEATRREEQNSSKENVTYIR